MAFERALGPFAFGARVSLGRLADAMGEAIGHSCRVVLIAADGDSHCDLWFL